MGIGVGSMDPGVKISTQTHPATRVFKVAQDAVLNDFIPFKIDSESVRSSSARASGLLWMEIFRPCRCRSGETNTAERCGTRILGQLP